jgi:hypothetical protein
MSDEDIPAWIECSDIMSRIREELILEAIDVLHREIEAGRITINADMIRLPEGSSETDRDLIVINNILGREDEIREAYSSYMNSGSDLPPKDPILLSRIDDLKKFLMSIKEMSMLMELGRTFGEMANESGYFPKEKTAAGVLRGMLDGNGERVDAVRFVLSSRNFVKNDALSEKDRIILSEAV